ncbi:MAG: tRNA pseudouridine(38-40) synthase TruA [Actinomycetota bacterium]|nr:tRNA pseudouridine(38-40) synthase TruA [Actinomycetota bacterium]
MRRSGAPPGAPDRAAVARVALGVAYDGGGFHGFAGQPGQRTVAGALEGALAELGAAGSPLTCAGRTDAGVHALAQVVHVDLDPAWLAALARGRGAQDVSLEPGSELPRLASALSALVAPDVVVWRATVAPPSFDARRSAVARRYRYELDLEEHGNPLTRHVSWHVGGPLDLAVMRLATDPVLGEHDFAAFCRRPPDRPEGPITRRVTDARWVADGPATLRFEIEAVAFCHQMVRSVVGAIVAAGSGRIRPSDVVALLRSGSRSGAPPIAPPHGLALVAVAYPEELGGRWEWPGSRAP